MQGLHSSGTRKRPASSPLRPDLRSQGRWRSRSVRAVPSCSAPRPCLCTGHILKRTGARRRISDSNKHEIDVTRALLRCHIPVAAAAGSSARPHTRRLDRSYPPRGAARRLPLISDGCASRSCKGQQDDALALRAPRTWWPPRSAAHARVQRA
ncbi:hypothetical protein C2E23DRAFT_271410 [Lenzites betulinus]|nr:hypothetical protein C2E23DRAFT_271329 [Lenzites betulinus]KAH9857384.1 hypothetical protein C2E23DRAFT_271410 [Lenzites betulinus]